MSGFGRSLCVAVAAAVSLPLTVVALAPVLGPAPAMSLHAVAWTALYLGVLARGPRERLVVVVIAMAFGTAAWALTAGLSELAIALGVLTAVVRSGWLYRRGTSYRPGAVRAVVVEFALLAGACATAGFVFRPGLVGAAAAVWGWFVVQSFYFLLGGISRRRNPARGDAFEDAARRLERLLEAQA